MRQRAGGAGAQQRHIDGDKASVDFRLAEVGILLDLAAGNVDGLGVYAKIIRQGGETELVPVQVVTLGDDPFKPRRLRAEGGRGQAKGGLRRQDLFLAGGRRAQQILQAIAD